MPGGENEIKTRISVDGAGEYQKQLKAAQQQLKLLQAELKRDTTALGANATAEQKNAVQAENLKRKIQQQQQVVAAMRKALEQAKGMYGENSTAVVQWQTRLANAESTLNSMNNQLDQLGDAMRDTGRVVTDTAQQTANLAEGMGKLKDVAGGAAQFVANTFQSTLNTVKGIVDEITALMDYAMGQVGNWKAISDVYGGSDADIQKMFVQYASAGMGMGQLTSDISNLVTRTHKGGADIEGVLSRIGISGQDAYSSHWDYYQAVMEALMTGGYGQGDIESMSEILFGKGNAGNATTLAGKWAHTQELVNDMNGSGAFLDQASIDAVDDFSQRMTDLQTIWSQIKTEIGAGFVVSIGTNITEDAKALLLDLSTIFSTTATDAEKKEAALKLSADINVLAGDVADVIANIATIFSEVGDNMAESDNPVVAAIGKLMQSAENILTWLSTNLPSILSIIESMLPYIKMNMVTKAITGQSVPQLFTGVLNKMAEILLAIKLFSGGGIGKGAAAAGASAGSQAAAGGLGALLTTTGAHVAGGAMAGLAYLTEGVWNSDKAAGAHEFYDPVTGMEYSSLAEMEAARAAYDPWAGITEGLINPADMASTPYAQYTGGQQAADPLGGMTAEQLAAAAQSGVAAGLRGVTFNVDGATMARAVSPYLVDEFGGR